MSKSAFVFKNMSMTFLNTNADLLTKRAKNLEATLISANFSKVFDSRHREKMEQIIEAYSLS